MDIRSILHKGCKVRTLYAPPEADVNTYYSVAVVNPDTVIVAYPDNVGHDKMDIIGLSAAELDQIDDFLNMFGDHGFWVIHINEIKGFKGYVSLIIQ